MEILNFIKNYWTQIIFFLGLVGVVIKYIKSANEAVKCSLRNDILSIWDKCKDKEEITLYQLSAMKLSYEHYKKLHGNSFVEEIMEKAKKFKIVD